MYVAASTGCFPDLSLQEALDKLTDLEYSAAEVVVGDDHGQIRLFDLVQQADSILQTCRLSRQISIGTLFLDTDPAHPDYLRHFSLTAQLAKALKVVVIIVHAAKQGSPFNGEVERLQQLTQIGIHAGVRVSLLTELGTISDTPETVGSLCKTVRELSVCLDPSQFIFGQSKPKDYDALVDYVSHVRLRDTTKDGFNVQIGQGVIEYGRLVVQLNKIGYQGALCADLLPIPDLDLLSELRKMRLLLESLL